MILVVDATVGIQMALNEKPEILARASTVVTPDLYLVEVTNAIWKYYRFENFSMERCEEMLRIALSIPDEIVPSLELCSEAFAVASLAEHPVYDMMYLALARRNAIPLATADRKLKRLAKKHGIEVV